MRAHPTRTMTKAYRRYTRAYADRQSSRFWLIVKARGRIMWDNLLEIWAGFSLAKLAYSVVLIAIIWLLANELLRIWWDRQLYVAAPNYFDDGKADTAKATTFGGQILAHHHRLRAELNSERERRAREAVEVGPAEVLRRWPIVKDSLSLPSEGLKQLELKIQGF